MNILTIITGPPGSGKTTLANELGQQVFDTDLGNKYGFKTYNGDCILITSAPKASQKSYWIEQAELYGFQPNLLAIVLPRMLVWQRMKARDGLSPTQRNDLEKGIEFWYANYTRHPQERVHSS